MNTDKKYWLDEPRNTNKLLVVLYMACIALVTADLMNCKHVHFEFEKWIGIYGWFGFAVGVGLIMVAGIVGLMLKREEDYYDR